MRFICFLFLILSYCYTINAQSYSSNIDGIYFMENNECYVSLLKDNVRIDVYESNNNVSYDIIENNDVIFHTFYNNVKSSINFINDVSYCVYDTDVHFFIKEIKVNDKIIKGVFFNKNRLSNENFNKLSSLFIDTKKLTDFSILKNNNEEILLKIKNLHIKNEELIKKYSFLFCVEKDEFDGIEIYRPKNISTSVFTNNTYCYFIKKNNKLYDFRFVLTYTSNDFLWIEYLIFNIDDENYTLYTSFKRDSGYNGNYVCISEWCNVSMIDIHSEIIEKISKSENVKIKIVGENYASIRVLSKKEILLIKKTYEYFIILGGLFR